MTDIAQTEPIRTKSSFSFLVTKSGLILDADIPDDDLPKTLEFDGQTFVRHSVAFPDVQDREQAKEFLLRHLHLCEFPE